MRTLFDIILVLALFTLPFTLVCILAFLGLLVFSGYIEFIVIALFAELIYRGGDIRVFGLSLSLTLLAILCFFCAEMLRIFVHKRMI